MGALAAGGTAISAYAQYSAAQAEADANEQKAYVKRLQAAESMAAAERDADIAIEKGKLIRSSQLSSYGRSGVDIEGSPLMQMSATIATARKEAEATLRAGKYRQYTSNYEAQLQDYMAGETRKAGTLTAAGTILGGFGNYSKAKGNL